MAAEAERNVAEVQDDGDVDRKLKNRIIETRQRVDDTEHYLYVEAPVEQDKDVNSLEQDIYWGMMVEQFIRTINPILNSDELENAEKYREEVPLADEGVKLYPRDTDKVPFQKYLNGSMSPVKFKLKYRVERNETLPKPVTREFDGLQSILDSDGTVSHTWTVAMEDGTFENTADEKAIPKRVYKQALMEADNFLQENGIGIEIGSGRPFANYSK